MNIFSLVQTALELGLICSLTVLALFLSYSMLNVCDLSTDGCFTLGAAVGAMVAIAGHPYLAILAAMGAGVVRRVLERLIALTIADEGLLKLDSFDRIIPCQDELPRGNSSIGNLVALPMQPEAKARGGSSFIRRDARLSFMRQARMHLRTSRRHRA